MMEIYQGVDKDPSHWCHVSFYHMDLVKYCILLTNQNQGRELTFFATRSALIMIDNPTQISQVPRDTENLGPAHLGPKYNLKKP